MHHGSRIIIDATGSRAQYSGGESRATARNPEPDTEPGPAFNRNAKDLAPYVKAARVWEDTLLIVQAERVEPDIGRKILEPLVQSPHTSRLKMVAVVSPDVNLDDDVDVIWGIFTRFDPARDLMFARSTLLGVQPLYEGVMGIDATWKPGYPDAVSMPEEITRLVDSKWSSY
jgi:3-polyprenyl-4-hydroxybenzoate decarboxylase